MAVVGGVVYYGRERKKTRSRKGATIMAHRWIKSLAAAGGSDD